METVAEIMMEMVDDRSRIMLIVPPGKQTKYYITDGMQKLKLFNK